MKKPLLAALIAGGFALAPAAAGAAEDYPARPVRMVVGFAAGGATDLFARTLAQKLSDKFGQQVVVDNRVGAGGSLGTDIVAKSPGDGYTLLFCSASHAINRALYKSLPFDPVADFEPISPFAVTSNVLVVHPSFPANTVAEFVALAKQKPMTINLASAGTGSSSHLAGELFKSLAGIQLVHVPYKGTADAMRDLLSGQVQSSVDSLPTLLPHINRGALKALGVGDARRIALLPNVPTLAEAGVAGYELYAWTGLLAPAKTPRAIVEKLHRETLAALKQPDVLKRLADVGGAPMSSTPEEFGTLIRNEIVKFTQIVKSAGVQAQ